MAIFSHVTNTHFYTFNWLIKLETFFLTLLRNILIVNVKTI